MKTIIIALVLTTFTLGFTAIGQADLSVPQIMAIVNNGDLVFLPDAQTCFRDAQYLSLEEYMFTTKASLSSVFIRNLNTKYTPRLFDCDDIARTAQALFIEEAASILSVDGVELAVPAATVILCNIHTEEGVHMINLFIFQGKAVMYDFGDNSLWTYSRLIENDLAIRTIQF